MITAGPTQEAIDPVRYISNQSSGKMGIALAEEAARRGAAVHLVLGPTHLKANHPNIRTIPVNTAQEMYKSAQSIHGKVDAAVFAAAVADYAPSQPATEKLKKTDEELHISLKKNPDIAYLLGAQKNGRQIHVGFALETEQESKFALEKLQKKNFDFIVLNSLKDEGAGFQKDTNQITLFFKNKPSLKTSVLPKKEIAGIILDELGTLLDTTTKE
jgi:phosphopantothenoylcysteine decarboxylase/phosphopantothenate--cysteine ligase